MRDYRTLPGVITRAFAYLVPQLSLALESLEFTVPHHSAIVLWRLPTSGVNDS